MTDRINALTVVLERDIRDDDIEVILSAISLLRGVLTVTPHVADHTSLVAEERVRASLYPKLLAVLDR